MPSVAALGGGVMSFSEPWTMTMAIFWAGPQKMQNAVVGEVPGTRGWTWPLRHHSRKLFSQAIKRWKLVCVCDELKCESWNASAGLWFGGKRAGLLQASCQPFSPAPPTLTTWGLVVIIMELFPWHPS